MRKVDIRTQVLTMSQEIGCYVAPLSPMSKIPTAKFKWHEESTRDEKKIKRWFGRDSQLNYLIDAGKSGKVIVDCDVKPEFDGRVTYSTWLVSVGLSPHPRSYFINTPSGGAHIYYDVDDPRDARNSVRKLGQGIDTRGLGGYVVGEGSRLRNGVYWPPESETALYDIGPAPQQLLDAIAQRPQIVRTPSQPLSGDITRQGSGRLGAALKQVSEATEGSRNLQLFKSVAWVAELIPHKAYEQQDVESLFLTAAQNIGLPAQEAIPTIRSGIRSGLRNARPMFSIDGGGISL